MTDSQRCIEQLDSVLSWDKHPSLPVPCVSTPCPENSTSSCFPVLLLLLPNKATAGISKGNRPKPITNPPKQEELLPGLNAQLDTSLTPITSVELPLHKLAEFYSVISSIGVCHWLDWSQVRNLEDDRQDKALLMGRTQSVGDYT